LIKLQDGNDVVRLALAITPILQTSPLARHFRALTH